MKNLITCLVVCVLSGAAFAQTPINEDYKLLASDGADTDFFGWSVALVGTHRPTARRWAPGCAAFFTYCKPHSPAG